MTQGNRKKILIVDDEANVRLLLANLLDKDYTILKAGNGNEAIDIARREKPDLILMDIMMPKMDGYTACHTIKRDKAIAGIPVVMLTALGYGLNKALAQEMGAEGYITKPFSPTLITETAERFLKA